MATTYNTENKRYRSLIISIALFLSLRLTHEVQLQRAGEK